MHPTEIEEILSTLTILVDTREQPTTSFNKRMDDMEAPWIRQKLDFGDYSAKCSVDNITYSLAKFVSIERKMSLGELCNCYCQGRKRFTREFERAREAQAKIYLLVEKASWQKIYSGQYRSRMAPQALLASITAWLARYDCQIVFCEPRETGKLIKEIMYREMKERLTNGKGYETK